MTRPRPTSSKPRSPRLRVSLAAAAAVVGTTALALPAAGLGVSAAQRSGAPLKPPGALIQLPGPSGCLVDRATPRRGCEPVRALRGPGPLLGSNAIAISPDGTSLYVASARSDAIAVFQRNRANGKLTQPPGPAGCIAAGPAAGCGLAVGLASPTSVTVSPDGHNVYATAAKSSSVAIFQRNPTTGALSQLPGSAGCVANTATPGCSTARALMGPDVVAVSPEGNSVYVGAFFGNAVVAFTRDQSTGALTQMPGTNGCIAASIAGCASGLALNGPEGLGVTADGDNVYVAAALSGAVDVLRRDPATGVITQATDGTGCLTSTPLSGCGTARALRGSDAVAFGPDGRNVYVTAGVSQSIAMFNRASGSGELIQPVGASGCVMDLLTAGCSPGRRLIDPEGLTVSPDGVNVYTASFLSGALGVFDRQPSTGALMQKPGRAGCVASTSKRDCIPGRGGLHGVSSVTVSPDGKYLYAVANASNSLTVFKRRTMNP